MARHTKTPLKFSPNSVLLNSLEFFNKYIEGQWYSIAGTCIAYSWPKFHPWTLHMIAQTLPGVISEVRVRRKPWALLGVSETTVNPPPKVLRALKTMKYRGNNWRNNKH